MSALHVLLLEDSATDAELALRVLRKAGLEFDALKSHRPDIVLADFNLPGFDGMQALALVREQAPHECVGAHPSRRRRLFARLRMPGNA
ncbi:MAG TPA: response regulator [Rhodocyclaceae bacterium]|nr:response regulator [Rhodocyclaceae bacterium]